MLDSDYMGRDMHCTNKSMLIIPRSKEISQMIKVHLIVGSLYSV
jgi:ATP adenylyltransferase/5',5'''-P-1,P-4-tetraphosphate phosphorylase II